MHLLWSAGLEGLEGKQAENIALYLQTKRVQQCISKLNYSYTFYEPQREKQYIWT